MSAFTQGLRERFGVVDQPDVRSVSASFGSEILRGAILAFVFSMFLIVVYIAFRFDWRYAVPMIVALIHDLIITIGVYSLFDREVSSATVAAVLTVLGYSLYDTIIIFDRVRENEAHLRKHTYDEIVNISLWETLTRSLNTSFITLLPILSLFIFGGETLQDFAFALLIGIASGAYSSFFIAAPLLAYIKGRQPEFRRRTGSNELPSFLLRTTPDARSHGRAGGRRPGRRDGLQGRVALGGGRGGAPAADRRTRHPQSRRRRSTTPRRRPARPPARAASTASRAAARTAAASGTPAQGPARPGAVRPAP